MIARTRFRKTALQLMPIVILLAVCAQVFAQDASDGLSRSSGELKRIDSPILPPVLANATQGSATTPAVVQNSNTTYRPLTARQKFQFGLAHAFLTPGAYAGPAVGAYFVERSEVKRPGKTNGDKFADGASRFARSVATRSTAEFLGRGLYPILFKQDPRYQPSDREYFLPRVLYAASRAFVTQGDNGKTQINISRLGGNLTAAVLANVYERDVVRSRDRFGRPTSFRRRVGVEPTLKSFALATAFDAASNIVFDEFDVIGKLRKILKR